MFESNLLSTKKAIGSMLGAAYGDALGWPNERAGRTKSITPSKGNKAELVAWERKSGGQYFPHIEQIAAGSYSDDTQLILCTSRALLHGDSWWSFLTKVEFPFWTEYERGGGGATKRAAISWLAGMAPWAQSRKSEDLRRYFEAGGNGVAMRVLPHIIYLHNRNFREVASNISLDAITTHGHPRAILGALAYGYALWVAFNKTSELAYGELIDALIEQADVWATEPELACATVIMEEWWHQAHKTQTAFSRQWKDAKQELITLLLICRESLGRGVLSYDDEVLTKLHCFDSKISGAGTVATIAAVYLASRHAATPITGVITAAFAAGADTDTISSMTGGLLGCIHGPDWLGGGRSKIQDAGYIEALASRLVSGAMDIPVAFTSLTNSVLDKWIISLQSLRDSESTELPDGRITAINYLPDYIANSGKFKVKSRRLTTRDGQTIFLSKIFKETVESSAKLTENKSFSQEQDLSNNSQRISITIPVASLEKSITFYKDYLSLAEKKHSPIMMVFKEGLVLQTRDSLNDLPLNFHPCAWLRIKLSNIEQRFNIIKGEKKFTILSPLKPCGENENYLVFKIQDPDGNMVEVFSDRPVLPNRYSEHGQARLGQSAVMAVGEQTANISNELIKLDSKKQRVPFSSELVTPYASHDTVDIPVGIPAALLNEIDGAVINTIREELLKLPAIPKKRMLHVLLEKHGFSTKKTNFILNELVKAQCIHYKKNKGYCFSAEGQSQPVLV